MVFISSQLWKHESIYAMKMVMEEKHTQSHFRYFFKKYLFVVTCSLFASVSDFSLQENDSLNALLYPKYDIACEILLILPASVAKALPAHPPLTLLDRV